MKSPITLYDSCIIAFYFVFIMGVGMLFRRRSKNTSDYFRAGGAMPWWITGTSAWIAGFSAWTFTGAAGKVYETGTLVLCLYYANVIGLALVFAYTCVRFRRMRVVTWMEAVRLRYGPATEQFYTWLKLPLQLLLSGVGLNAIGVFMSSVFHMDMTVILIVLGVAVTLVSFAGGAWAVLASDFIQMFLVMTITIVTAILTLRLPQIGGLTHLLHTVPSYHSHWTELARPEIIGLWIVVMVWNGVTASNTMEGATMYLMTKNDKDAKRMVLIPLIGSLIGPLIWFIPSMAATILHPNLAGEFPALKAPHEAAFVAVCIDVLPQGLLGLMVCAMLGATLTSMDASLNKGAGVFVRSFYLPKIDPNCTEKRLLVVSKVCTLVFGALIILVAVEFSKFRTMGLFDLTNLLAASLLGPLALPLLWGLFFKKTPAWSAWTTVVIAAAMSYIATNLLHPEMFQHLLGWNHALSKREQTDLTLFETTFMVVTVGTAWYFFTSLFYDKSPQEHKDRVERFFTHMKTPIDGKAEGIVDVDETVYRMIGGLCVVYGVFVLFLMLIPNTPQGRLCFFFCGGTILAAGLVLSGLARKLRREATLAIFSQPVNDAAAVELLK
jgi:SSS family solute:Na+ symporter